MRFPSWLLISVMLLVLAGPSEVNAQGWTDTLDFPDDPLAVAGQDHVLGWIKFMILTGDPTTVYFQNSLFYPFHYDFAVAQLPAFSGMSPGAFDQATLYSTGQIAHLGAVILPPTVSGSDVFFEYGIELVRQDAYTPTEVRDLFNLVKSKVVAAPPAQAIYFPTFEQLATAEANEAFFTSEGIEIGSSGRWAQGNVCYSTGWALGELKYFETAQIDPAFLAGTLTSDDILLTDAVPAEIPPVAGVITLSPSTPSSHVAILAETFGMPFLHVALATDAARAQNLVGHRIVLRGQGSGSGTVPGCTVKMIDVEGVLDPPTIDSILALKAPPLLQITPTSSFGCYSASTDGLLPIDIRYFGGKAANFGLLRQSIPANSPVSMALSFDLWDDFMDQDRGGQTLRQEIAQLLAPFTYPPNISNLDSTLNTIRDLIKDTGQTSFTPTQQATVLGALQDAAYGFDPFEKLRFRSSTNVEDSDQFVGAGLYDSFSGCLQDELDGDGSGPSACDPGESNERGVFRAIRKVYASFYNLNAFLERLRHQIDESQVGMALLVHHSFPDELELANGVATYEWGPGSDEAFLVTLPDDNSVTNPQPGQLPEEVRLDFYSFGTFATLLAETNLLPIGSTVFTFSGEYTALGDLIELAADAYQTATGLIAFKLEFEYKKMDPGGELIVKQIRRIPEADSTLSVTPFLLNEPVEYCSFEGESSNVFALHRLESRWNLETQNVWLSNANLQGSFWADSTLEYSEVCQSYSQAGPLDQWPQASHAYVGRNVLDSWTFSSLQNPRTYQLTVHNVPDLVAPADIPIFVLSDFGCLDLQVVYQDPVPFLSFSGVTDTTTDSIRLCRCPQSDPLDQLRQYTYVNGPVSVDVSYYLPPPLNLLPGYGTAGYTAPLVRFDQTVITGLTSTPIVLDDERSQTFRPEHHNTGRNFMFEPALEPDLPAATLAELEAADVRVIHTGTYVPAGAEVDVYGAADWDACLSCTGFDGDGDGVCTAEAVPDCDDGDPTRWAVPGEVLDLRFATDADLSWSPPTDPGATSVAYDVIRSGSASDFVGAGVCIESDDDTDTLASDAQSPAASTVFFYLSRAENDCPAGMGTLGFTSSATERAGRVCP